MCCCMSRLNWHVSSMDSFAACSLEVRVRRRPACKFNTHPLQAPAHAPISRWRSGASWRLWRRWSALLRTPSGWLWSGQTALPLPPTSHRPGVGRGREPEGRESLFWNNAQPCLPAIRWAGFSSCGSPPSMLPPLKQGRAAGCSAGRRTNRGRATHPSAVPAHRCRRADCHPARPGAGGARHCSRWVSCVEAGRVQPLHTDAATGCRLVVCTQVLTLDTYTSMCPLWLIPNWLQMLSWRSCACTSSTQLPKISCLPAAAPPRWQLLRWPASPPRPLPPQQPAWAVARGHRCWLEVARGRVRRVRKRQAVARRGPMRQMPAAAAAVQQGCLPLGAAASCSAHLPGSPRRGMPAAPAAARAVGRARSRRGRCSSRGCESSTHAWPTPA